MNAFHFWPFHFFLNVIVPIAVLLSRKRRLEYEPLNRDRKTGNRLNFFLSEAYFLNPEKKSWFASSYGHKQTWTTAAYQ